VLATDFPDEWQDIIAVLLAFRLKKSAIVAGGGNKSPIAAEVDAAFATRGWVEKLFKTEITEIVVDDRRRLSPTHKWTTTRTSSASKWSGTTRIRSTTAI
jgi:hypothetical protein